MDIERGAIMLQLFPNDDIIVIAEFILKYGSRIMDIIAEHRADRRTKVPAALKGLTSSKEPEVLSSVLLGFGTTVLGNAEALIGKKAFMEGLEETTGIPASSRLVEDGLKHIITPDSTERKYMGRLDALLNVIGSAVNDVTDVLKFLSPIYNFEIPEGAAGVNFDGIYELKLFGDFIKELMLRGDFINQSLLLPANINRALIEGGDPADPVSQDAVQEALILADRFDQMNRGNHMINRFDDDESGGLRSLAAFAGKLLRNPIIQKLDPTGLATLAAPALTALGKGKPSSRTGARRQPRGSSSRRSPRQTAPAAPARATNRPITLRTPPSKMGVTIQILPGVGDVAEVEGYYDDSGKECPVEIV